MCGAVAISEKKTFETQINSQSKSGCALCFNQYKPSVLLLDKMQTVQNQVRRHWMWCLIKFFTVYAQNVLFKFELNYLLWIEIYYLTSPTNRNWLVQLIIVGNPFGLNWLNNLLIYIDDSDQQSVYSSSTFLFKNQSREDCNEIRKPYNKVPYMGGSRGGGQGVPALKKK